MTEDRADLRPLGPEDEEVESLTPDLRVLLRQDAVWATAPPALEVSVMRELGISSRTDNVVPLPRKFLLTGKRVRRTGRRLALVAAAMAAVAGLGSTIGVAALNDGDDPDARMRLTGTALMQGSLVEAELRSTPSGTEITFDAKGLPPAPPDSYYQGWVVGTLGAVTIGTFHMRGGSKDVVLWSGVELADYPTMTVTLQQEGGGPASSGKVLLRGEVPDGFR